MNKQEVLKVLDFYFNTIKNILGVTSNNFLPCCMPYLKYEEVNDFTTLRATDGGYSFRIYCLYRFFENDDKIETSEREWTILRTKWHLRDGATEDKFYEQVLSTFLRILTWGKNDMDIRNILSGKSNFNWLDDDKEVETARHIVNKLGKEAYKGKWQSIKIG